MGPQAADTRFIAAMRKLFVRTNSGNVSILEILIAYNALFPWGYSWCFG